MSPAHESSPAPRGVAEVRRGRAAELAARAAQLTEANDHALALALLANDAAAPGVAWLRFSSLVRRIVHRAMVPHQDAEDVVQEIFLRVFQQLPTLRNPVALRAFVIAIAVRAGQYHLRQISLRNRGHFDASDPIDEIGGTTDVESQYALIRFCGLLDRIRERDRAAFILRFIEGRNIQDIARLLGTSKPTVQRRLIRARARVSLLAERDAFLVAYTRRHAIGRSISR